MPADEAHIKDMRSLIAAARQQPVNFGLCLGPKPDTDTLLMHRTKGAKALSVEAKAQAKGTKAAFGTAAVEGNLMSLACEEKPPTGLAKRTRLMLKAMKLPLKVRLVGADGEVFEEDGDEEGEAQSGKEATSVTQAAAKLPEPTTNEAPKPAKPGGTQDTAALAKLLAALAPRIPAAVGADEARRAALLKLATQANVYLKTNNPSYAANTIEQLRAEIEGGSPTPPVPPSPPPSAPDPASLARQLAGLIPQVAHVTDPARKAELGKLAQMGNVYLKSNNLNAAAGSISELTRALDSASSAISDTAYPAETYEIAGRTWLTARQDVEDSLERLRTTILAAYEGQPITSQIDQAFRSRTAPVMRTLDARLAQKLSSASKADAALRPQLLDEVRSILGTYEEFSADPLLADLDDNPFVSLSIRQTLDTALRTVASEVR